MNKLRIALAQINTTVGDLGGNSRAAIECSRKAEAEGVDIIAFPELTIPGYPPEDLVLKPDFVRRNIEAVNRVAEAVGDLTAVVGFVDTDGADIYNAAAIIQQGTILGVYHKCFLPNYAVFDEQRYFKAGKQGLVFHIRGSRVGITICEDIWYPIGPATLETAAGAEVIVNINASPFSVGRQRLRERMIATRAQDEIAYVAYVNLVGGQDELVFEGGSMVLDWDGEMVTKATAFDEDFIVADLDIGAVFSARLHDTRRRQMSPGPFMGSGPAQIIHTPLSDRSQTSRSPLPSARSTAADCSTDESEVYSALVLGLKDYAGKNGFSDVVLGLSGGIDSALTAVIAADALGPEHVTAVSMPSQYSSEHSKTDAAHLAKNLSIKHVTIPIEDPAQATLRILEDVFVGRESDITEENLQARIRANILMALSNKFGWLVLTTGNKSEVAVGFSTLYGDSAGGFSVLKDIYKTMVFDLSRWRNSQANCDVIPRSIIDKEPSAELAPGQRDVDRLPPYEELDPILSLYIEDDRSLQDIVGAGHEQSTVEKVLGLIDANEYKRRQQPPGTRVSSRAFGKDRRLPITNGYRP